MIEANIQQLGKYSKKDIKNSVQYAMAHMDRTNPINFREKYDFFYYHSNNIIEVSEADKFNFLKKVILENSKLDPFTRNKKKQYYFDKYLDIKEPVKELENLKSFYRTQEKEVPNNFRSKVPNRGVISELVKREIKAEEKVKLRRKIIKSMDANEKQTNNLDSNVLNSKRYKNEEFFKTRDNFFNVNKMTGTQMFEFFKDPFNASIYNNRDNLKKSLKTQNEKLSKTFQFCKSIDNNESSNHQTKKISFEDNNDFYNYYISDWLKGITNNKSFINDFKSDMLDNKVKEKEQKEESNKDESKKDLKSEHSTFREFISNEKLFKINMNNTNGNLNSSNLDTKRSKEHKLNTVTFKKLNTNSFGIDRRSSKLMFKQDTNNRLSMNLNLSNIKSENDLNKNEQIKKEFINKKISDLNIKQNDSKTLSISRTNSNEKSFNNNNSSVGIINKKNAKEKNNEKSDHIVSLRNKSKSFINNDLDSLKRLNKVYNSNSEKQKNLYLMQNSLNIVKENLRKSISDNPSCNPYNKLNNTRKNSILEKINKSIDYINNISMSKSIEKNKLNKSNSIIKEKIDIDEENTIFTNNRKVSNLIVLSPKKRHSNIQLFKEQTKKQDLYNDPFVKKLLRNENKVLNIDNSNEKAFNMVSREFRSTKAKLNKNNQDAAEENRRINNMVTKVNGSMNIIKQIKEKGKRQFLIERNNDLTSQFSKIVFEQILDKEVDYKDEFLKHISNAKNLEEYKKLEIENFINNINNKTIDKNKKTIKAEEEKNVIDENKKKAKKVSSLDKTDELTRKILAASSLINIETDINDTEEKIEEVKIEPEIDPELKRLQEEKNKKFLKDINNQKRRDKILYDKNIGLKMYLLFLKKFRKYLTLEFAILKKLNQKKLRFYSQRKHLNVKQHSNFIISDLHMNHLMIKIFGRSKTQEIGKTKNVRKVKVDEIKKINLFKHLSGKLFTKSEFLINLIVNEDIIKEEEQRLEMLNKKKEIAEEIKIFKKPEVKKRKDTKNLEKYTENYEFKKYEVNAKRNQSVVNIEELKKKKQNHNSLKLNSKDNLDISYESSDADENLEKPKIINKKPEVDKKFQKYMDLYLFDNNSKEINKVIYGDDLLDITKVLNNCNLNLLSHINPNKMKFENANLAIKKIRGQKLIDCDIILEYIEQKYQEVVRRIAELDPKKIKKDFDNLSFPIFIDKFNKMFEEYPERVRDIIKTRWIHRFGDPFKNPNLMINMGSTYMDQMIEINAPNNPDVDNIIQKCDLYLKAKKFSKYDEIGEVKIMKVPREFYVQENKSNIKNVELEKNLKKRINMEEYKKITNLSKNKHLCKTNLKGFSSFNNCLESILNKNLSDHNNLVSIQKDYSKKSMFIDPRLSVYEQKKYRFKKVNFTDDIV